jgi:hypothetical protein
LNVHQTPALIGEPLRFAWAAAYGAALLSETLADPFPLKPHQDFIQADYGDPLIHAALELNDTMRREAAVGESHGEGVLGPSLFYRLCIEWKFPRGVNEALSEMQREGQLKNG